MKWILHQDTNCLEGGGKERIYFEQKIENEEEKEEMGGGGCGGGGSEEDKKKKRRTEFTKIDWIVKKKNVKTIEYF